MNVIETLMERNNQFAATTFSPDWKMMPSMRTFIIGCIDPRVDPVEVFGLKPNETAVLRNIGGRITPNVLETMGLVGTLSKAAGKPVGEGWNLIILHHTDCGIIGCNHLAPDLLAKNMGVTKAELEGMAVNDPYKSVAYDVAALKANPNLPGSAMVTGIVYDVATGKTETVVKTALLRPEAKATSAA